MRATGELAVAAGSISRRVARAVLTWAVRGRRATGGEWGEAILAEFDQTTGSWEAFRWTLGGVRVAWRERRGGRSSLGWVAAALWCAGWRRRLLVLGLAAGLLVVVVNQFVVTIRYIPTMAMQPGLTIDDRVLADRVGFRVTGVGRSDVVLIDSRIADPSTARPEKFVTRVLGLPGDTISCVNGKLLRNGAPVAEPYLAVGTVTDCQPVKVPAGSVYVLGDNRQSAADSRIWGPVAERGIVGRVLVRVWPPSRIGPPA